MTSTPASVITAVLRDTDITVTVTVTDVRDAIATLESRGYRVLTVAV